MAYKMAAATTQEVSTQLISSWGLPMLPCTCGSATMAMVVFSACMMIASIIAKVITSRLVLLRGSYYPAGTCVNALCGFRIEEKVRQTSDLGGVDFDYRGPSPSQLMMLTRFQLDTYGNPLAHLEPITRCVLCR